MYICTYVHTYIYILSVVVDVMYVNIRAMNQVRCTYVLNKLYCMILCTIMHMYVCTHVYYVCTFVCTHLRRYVCVCTYVGMHVFVRM